MGRPTRKNGYSDQEKVSLLYAATYERYTGGKNRKNEFITLWRSLIEKHSIRSNRTDSAALQQLNALRTTRRLSGMSDARYFQTLEAAESDRDNNRTPDLGPLIRPGRPEKPIVDNQEALRKEDQQEIQALYDKFQKTKLDDRPIISAQYAAPATRDYLTCRADEVIQEIIKRAPQDLWHLGVAVYAAGYWVCEKCKGATIKNPKEAPKTQGTRFSVETKWEKQIQALRAQLGHLQEWKNKKGAVSEKVKNSVAVITRQVRPCDDQVGATIAEKKNLLNVRAHKMRLRKEARERERQVRLFRNRRRFHRFLDREKCYNEEGQLNTEEAAPPKFTPKEAADHWAEVWSKPDVFKKSSIDDIPQVKPADDLEYTTEMLRERIRNAQNWASAGPDKIHNYWWKWLTGTHDPLCKIGTEWLNGPGEEWVCTGDTCVIPKVIGAEAVDQYRPISTLNCMYKLLTGMVADVVWAKMVDEKLVAPEQMANRAKIRGTHEALLMDKTIVSDARRHNHPLWMVYYDFRRAFDNVSHTAALTLLERYGAPKNVVEWFRKNSKLWKTRIRVNGELSEEVRVRSGVFQGDSLSVVIFLLIMNVISKRIREAGGYKLGPKTRSRRGGLVRSHLGFMDDAKTYAESEDQADAQEKAIVDAGRSVGLELNKSKCARVFLKPRNWKKLDHRTFMGENGADGDEFLDEKEEGIRTLRSEEYYKYLGNLQSGAGTDGASKKFAIDKFFRRTKAVLKLLLNSKAKFHTINTWALPPLRYFLVVLEWKEKELEDIDRTIHDFLETAGEISTGENPQWLYLERSQGGRGLSSVKSVYERDTISFEKYVRELPEDDLLKQVCTEKYSPEGSPLYKIGERALDLANSVNVKIDSALPELQYAAAKREEARDKNRAKDCAGAFMRLVKPKNGKGRVGVAESLQWHNKCQLSSYHEKAMYAIRQQNLWTRSRLAKQNPNISPLCRYCKNSPETVAHITAGCPCITWTRYKERHDKVARAIHHAILTSIGRKPAVPHYKHKPAKVVAVDGHEIWWDPFVPTARRVSEKHPDIMWFTGEQTFFIEICTPCDHNVVEWQDRKSVKYQALELDRRYTTGKPAKTIPIVIGATGVVTNDLASKVKELPCYIDIKQLQKISTIETIRIVKSFLR